MRWMSCVVSLAVFALAAGCKENMAQDKTTPKRDINAVLRDHDKELLAVPGVVGVYVGALEDGRTPCLKIMLARRTPEAERQIPRLIEGYRVVQEVTGEIRPLGTP